jgi:hypothetical protein
MQYSGNYLLESMKKHKKIVEKLSKESENYYIDEFEQKKLKRLRKERNNKDIYLSVQSSNIAIEIIDNEHYLLHDIRKKKVYRRVWHSRQGMPIIDVFVPYVDILYKSKSHY